MHKHIIFNHTCENPKKKHKNTRIRGFFVLHQENLISWSWFHAKVEEQNLVWYPPRVLSYFLLDLYWANISFQCHVSLTLWIILLYFKHVHLILHISLSCLTFVSIIVKVMGCTICTYISSSNWNMKYVIKP
jgi:hypothetical protein